MNAVLCARAALLAVCVALGACAARASQFPMVVEHQPSDASASCEALGAELQRVVVLRREIGREASHLNGRDTTNVLLDSLIAPPMLLVAGLPTLAGASARNARLGQTADASDVRLRELVRLRASHDCTPLISQHPDAEAVLATALESSAGPTRPERTARAQAVDAFAGALGPSNPP